MRNFLLRNTSLFVLLVSSLIWSVNLNGQTVLINPTQGGGFELGTTLASNGWTEVNGAQTNKWFVGTAAVPNSGTNSAYISSSADGSTYVYNPVTSVVMMYQDVTIPAGENVLELSFNWKGTAETCCDYLRVWLTPTTYNPTPGTQSTALNSGGSQLGGNLNAQAAYVAAQFAASVIPGNTYRLVFEWRNDGSVGTVPASIDDVSLTSRPAGTFISITTGDWGTASTWDANAVPTVADNVTVSTGDLVTINAPGQGAGTLIVNGTLVFGATPLQFNVNGNLTVNTGGLVNVFTGTTGRTLFVSGNIINNGRIDLSVGAAGAGTLNLNGSTVQSVTGSGSFGGTIATTDNTNRVDVIRNLVSSNTSTATPNIIWEFNSRIMHNLNFTGARMDLNGGTLYFGNYGIPGALTAPIGTGVMDGSFVRYWTATATGTGIFAGTDPTNTTSRYPFLSNTGANRAMYIQRTGGTTGSAAGYLGITYADNVSVTNGLTIDDAGYIINSRYDGNWTVFSSDGYVHNNGHTVAMIAAGAYTALNGNSRIMLANAPTGGTHQNGTTTPGAQRLGLSLANLTEGSLYIGVGLADATPSTPGDLVQSPGAPTCTDGTDITASGSPEPGVEWYWQTSETGTDIGTPYTGPYTVFANGTYYLRALNTLNSVWSAAVSSIEITNFPLAPAPLAPVADINPSCAPTGSQVTVEDAPLGTEYYWQTALNGTSTATPVTGALTITTSTTVYVSAYETASQCWSPTSSLVVTVGTFTPEAPSVDNSPILACTGISSAVLVTTAPASTGSVVYTFGTNQNFPGNTVTTLSQNISLPSGATVTSATLTFTNVNIAGGSWLNDVTIGMNGSATLGNTVLAPVFSGVTNGGPYNFSPTVVGNGSANLVVNHGWSGTFTAGSITLTINYNLPASTITWFDAITGGNQLGATANLETVGTSVLPNTTIPGNYDFYARSFVNGCYSNSVLGTVSISEVNAQLIPIDATCNGGENGSFTLGTIECGTEPFLYSVDGGAFGAIPTNLAAGTYSVVIQDDGGLLSAPIAVVVGQPAPPANLALVDANYFTADISWTTTGDETSWTVEYGLAGFTPGTGIEVVVFTNFTTLTGLTENTAYQFYVTANCGAGSQAGGPANFNTNNGFFTWDNQCGPGFIDISATATNTYNLGDDGEVGFTLPWTLNYQGTGVTLMTIGNNGGILFGTLTGQLGFGNGTMAAAANGLYPFWDDLGNNCTVRTEIQGTAPNRLAIFQWNGTHLGFNEGTPFVFQIIIEEATDEIYYIYDNAVTGSATYDYGASATIGAAGPNTDLQVSFNSPTYLQNNSCVHFYDALCPNPILVSNQIFQEEVILDWNAGLYGETEWTIIYGPAGFDPATGGTTLSGLTNSEANIFGLTQLTDYDAYIYAECQLDDLTSPGLLVSFQTLPWCANPTALGGTVAVDSLFATWNWSAVSGATNGGVSGFNIQYGSIGFDLYNGTVEVATGVDLADTVANPAFLAGGVYQYYVQAVCGTDTSNYSGPFTFVMPLTNDAVCGAEMLSADGTVYTFNNTGATVETGESTIAPPATGANTETGWINSIVNNSTWFTFVAPASGSVRVNNTAINYNGQAAVYEATDCADWTSFELMAANDNSMLSSSLAPNFSVCGLTPGATYYLMHDGFNATTGNYSISITPIVLNAGALVDVMDVCTCGSVDLFDGISGYDNGGVWSAELPSAGTQLVGSEWNSAGFAYQIFNFEYRMTDGCAFDTTFAKVRVWAPSNAGTDGSVTVCRNEPFDLLSGLNGTVDLGGTWLNPSLQPLASSAITASNIPGQFNYYYIAGNGICPDDTALVLVNVSSTCNYLDVEEMFFGTMTIMPNPSNGVFNISNLGSTEVFNYEVTDLDGRVIFTKDAAINGTETTVVNLTDKVTGMYMIRVYNDNAEKIFRVIKQ